MCTRRSRRAQDFYAPSSSTLPGEEVNKQEREEVRHYFKFHSQAYWKIDRHLDRQRWFRQQSEFHQQQMCNHRSRPAEAARNQMFPIQDDNWVSRCEEASLPKRMCYLILCSPQFPKWYWFVCREEVLFISTAEGFVERGGCPLLDDEKGGSHLNLELSAMSWTECDNQTCSDLNMIET